MSRSRPNKNRSFGATTGLPGGRGHSRSYSRFSMELNDYYSGWNLSTVRRKAKRLVKKASRKTERQALKKENVHF